VWTLEAKITDRRERLQRTDKSDYVVSTMRDLEAYARTEKRSAIAC
jgi:hypothetical protein